VGEPCHGTVRSKTTQCNQLCRHLVLLVSIETKAIAINYMYVEKVIVSLLTKPIPSDMFKTHILSLGIHKVQFSNISCHVIDKVLL